MSKKQQLIDFILARKAIGKPIQPLEVAKMIAFLVHGGKLRDSGKPVLSHIFEVASDPVSEEDEIASILHDVREDTFGPNGEITGETWLSHDFILVGIPLSSVELSDNMTRRQDQLYLDHIRSLVDGNVRRKRKDFFSNSGPSTPPERQKKYDLADGYLAARQSGMPFGTPVSQWILEHADTPENWALFDKHSSEERPDCRKLQLVYTSSAPAVA